MSPADEAAALVGELRAAAVALGDADAAERNRLLEQLGRGLLRPVEAIADVLPLTYFLDVVNGIYLDGDSLFADPTALGVVAAWGVAGLVITMRRFSWMPRER